LKKVRHFRSYQIQFFPFIVVQIPSVTHKEAVKQDHLKPSDKVKDLSSTTGTTTTSVTTTVSESSLPTPKVTDEKKDNKKKRYIDDDDRFDGLLDDEINEDGSYQLPYYKPDDTADHTLHAKIKEKSATIHDNADSKFSRLFIRIYLIVFFRNS
jgi:hypothetical protein